MVKLLNGHAIVLIHQLNGFFSDDKFLLGMFLSEIINSINWIMMVTMVAFNCLTIQIAM